MSNSSGNWFGKLFKKVSEPKAEPNHVVAPKPAPEKDIQPGAPYKKGDFIGQKYEVYGILGKGGCGVVYLVYSHEVGGVFALKTFQDEFLADEDVRKRFHKEASVWVELGRHPYLVRALAVDEVSGRLYVAMEYIAPNEQGLNSLDGYLQQQPDLAQSLRWAIQICYGMEYAYSKGVRAHRDLKPANIMITQDRIAKITDFGLAGVFSESLAMRATGPSAQPGQPGLSGQTMLGTGFGTPTHMAPEQFDNAAGCDERSDIYSFGIVLYQMVTGGRLPFPVPVGVDWQTMRQLHRKSSVPQLHSPLFPIIQRCLEKSPEKRYRTFNELRGNLEQLLQYQTGEVITPPQLKELEAWEWNDKGFSLNSLGRHEEAIRCYDKTLELDPCIAATWSNKGASLHSLGRHEEAIHCFDKALKLDPRYALAWTNKGGSLSALGRHEEAIRCYDKTLELDPHHAGAWNNKGSSFHGLGRHEEAIHCFDKTLELDPHHVNAWYNKGNSLDSLGRSEEAICCYDKTLELDPHYAGAWNNKGNSLRSLGRYEEAILCFDQALKLDPRLVYSWINKGNSLLSLDRYEEAIRCYDKILELDPRFVYAWFYKALAEDNFSKRRDAVRSYQQFLALAPSQYAKQIEFVRKRLRELGSK
jgi:tetratricopeptide (TPR) repeat protein